jgi:hypothetical protein
MFTHPEAVSDFGGTTHSASSFNTAAYCFTERHSGTAANSAASPHTTADAYRFPASYSSAATVSGRVTSDPPSPRLRRAGE